MGEMRCNISKTGAMLSIVIGMSTPIFLLGLTFNAMTLWMFCWKFRKWTETVIYVINLAVSDTMLLLSLPFKMYSYKPREELASSFCAFIECLYFVNMYVSIYIIVCISMDRCIAIKYPLKAKSFRSPMKAAIACGAIWTFVCLVAISLQIQFAADSVNAKSCFLKQTDEPTDTWIIIIIELFGFIIPFIILSFCSLQIIMTLCKKSTESQGNFIFSRSITIIATNLIIFILCFFPFHAALLMQFLMDTFQVNCAMLMNSRMFVTVSTCLANVNCCLDGIIYYFASKEVRASLTQHIRRISGRKKLSLGVIEVQNTQDTQQSDYL
ncbi:G-protein coupled receptor 35-like [Scyliorhinus canicula]|uniref:G-protein coupled receptor 35-like n=1 Tax=Scyliorhinus canicula TaxID=7830 RepID=UPI0018F59695|nr:G-protein coupled receptor 35-like [Scyliorhinus canicula]XP_038670947.1 G-protein coupled receptor 35-like [Scyliorhinus canicula]XP_038670948.1 G-protein coupled receptor 35-like [Scyliorhinus canicula]